MNIDQVAIKLQKYKPMAMYFAKNEMLAGDVIQEAFVKIHKKYVKEGSLDFIKYKDDVNESYIFLVIKSCYIDIIRKEQRYVDGISADNVNYTEEPTAPSVLENHLRGLSWYEKQLTKIYFEDEHSIRSLADATKISATNIFLTLKKTKEVIKNNIEMEINDEIKAYVKEKGKKKKTTARKRKPKNQSKGLADTVEKVTKATGIKKLVDKFTPDGEDCGCEKRKLALNKLFPYMTSKCMNEDQYKLWGKTIKKFESNTIHNDQLKVIAQLHSEIFNHKYTEPCRCEPKSWRRYIDDIDKVYQTYKED